MVPVAGGSRKEIRVATIVTTASLQPAGERLVRLMQGLNFGRLEGLAVRAGEPVFDPPPRVIREFKPGSNGKRSESQLSDFALRKELADLFDYFSRVQNVTILSIQVIHGLPFKVEVEEGLA
jgi:hypothetical protein